MWIEHDGKGAPDLPPGTMVLVRHRVGIDWTLPDPWEYWTPDEDDEHDFWTFSRSRPEHDIVAYRIAKR